MANVIKHKRGSGSDPGASDLVVGEVAIRTDVGKLFTKMDNGSVAEIAGGGSDIAINTLSSSSATGGGSATFNGSAYRFTLSAPPSVSAQQLLVSINGVIQKPVAGTGQPSEGFSVDGTDIILGDAPATGADFFILTFKSLGVSEPADNSVTSAKIADGAIVNADINASAAIARTKLANVDLVDDTSPQLGGALDTNGNAISFGDSSGNGVNRLTFGALTHGDLEIYHDGNNSYIQERGTGYLHIRGSDSVRIQDTDTAENMAVFNKNGAVELYHDNSKKFETTAAGVTATGNIDFTGNLGAGDNARIRLGNSTDLQIYHNGTHSYIENATGGLYVKVGNGEFLSRNGNEVIAKFLENAAVELYYDNSKKFETISSGVQVSGTLFLADGGSSSNRISIGNSGDLQIYHDGTHSKLVNSGGDLHLASNNAVKILGGSDLAEVQAVFNNDGAVELYFDNSKKLETWSGGVTATGGFYSNETNGTSFKAEDNGKFIAGGGNDLQIYHDGNNSFIENAGVGSLNLYGDEVNILNKARSEFKAKFITDGAVELYHDNTHMISTASDGIQLQTNKRLSRHPNSNSTILEVTNASYAKSLYIGGWDFGTNSSGISRIRNSNDNLHLDCGSGGELFLNAYAAGDIRTRRTRPISDNLYDLGSSSMRWDDVFATNGTIQTSDKTKKNTIVDSDLGLSFINKLKPVSYKFNDGTRTHYGLIAQDIETVLSDISKPSTDFAGFIKTDLPDEYYQEAEPNIPEGKKEGDLKSAAHTEYGLRYTEFISPLIKAVQELAAKVEVLEAK